MNENYWKDKYQDFWHIAAEKEEKIKRIIEEECDCICEFSGLGAGSTEYLSGSAKSRGFKKGGSDLKVKNTNIFIEVTGPNVDYVGKEAPLWIRPDKIHNAINNPKNDYWIVHVLKKDFFIRVIHIDNNFKKEFTEGLFKIDRPRIRGIIENYVSIPVDSNHIKDIDFLFQTIQS